MNPRISDLFSRLTTYLQGKKEAIRLCLLALFSKGHILIEDLPGLGKTTLALALSKCLDLSFGRIQCTSDLLPTDILGVSIYDRNLGCFNFHPGPIFSNIVLCDEINRAPPKTQSALLEAMAEYQVTVDGKTYRLPKPFFIIATQNPLEQFGTYPLPDSQLDRFTMKISIGYPSQTEEKEILRIGDTREDLMKLEPVISRDEVERIQEEIEKRIYVSDKILDYILRIVSATRKHEYLQAGLSTRGALTVLSVAKANAFFEGRDYVIPEDIKSVAEHVIPHRLFFKEEYEFIDKRGFVKSLIEGASLPV